MKSTIIVLAIYYDVTSASKTLAKISLILGTFFFCLLILSSKSKNREKLVFLIIHFLEEISILMACI